jgi:hypothetical protein
MTPRLDREEKSRGDAGEPTTRPRVWCASYLLKKLRIRDAGVRRVDVAVGAWSNGGDSLTPRDELSPVPSSRGLASGVHLTFNIER